MWLHSQGLLMIFPHNSFFFKTTLHGFASHTAFGFQSSHLSADLQNGSFTEAGANPNPVSKKLGTAVDAKCGWPCIPLGRPVVPLVYKMRAPLLS